jgi:hypothetical protein
MGMESDPSRATDERMGARRLRLATHHGAAARIRQTGGSRGMLDGRNRPDEVTLPEAVTRQDTRATHLPQPEDTNHARFGRISFEDTNDAAWRRRLAPLADRVSVVVLGEL